ncbi:hypothetical protein SprV_0301350400 [Sparganum proliferum]
MFLKHIAQAYPVGEHSCAAQAETQLTQSPREICHLDYISRFTSDIRHIDGSRNEVADALSRPSIAHLQLSPGIDLAEMAAEQRRVGSPCDEDVSGLQLQELPLTTGNGTSLCDVSTPSHRPFVPPFLRRKVFSSLHCVDLLPVGMSTARPIRVQSPLFQRMRNEGGVT